ncbi:MAG: hypothetical protein WA840_24090 [Caulobacteraceae bacterium]
MKHVFERIEKRKRDVERHVVFSIFSELESIGLPQVENMLDIWAPLLIHLSMTFRDINNMYYMYSSPEDEFQEAINAHVSVDSEHWRMMIEDIKTLGVNGRAFDCESAIDIIWSDLGIPVRKYMYSLMYRARRCGECPFLKISAIESAEVTSKVFFGISMRLAGLYERHYNKSLYYLGEAHINNEIEHSIDLSLFSSQSISIEKMAVAYDIVDDHFDSFINFLNFKHEINMAVLEKK